MGRYHYPLLNALVQIYDRHGIHVFQNLFRWVEAQGEANNLVFDVKVYGREETHPYSVLYMERLAEVFRNAAAIDERELFLEYAALR